MPDPALSAALKEAYACARTDVVDYATIELRHPAFSSPIRVVNDYADLTARLEAGAPQDALAYVTFVAFAFRLQLPKVERQGIPELVIEIDNVSREIVRNIRAAAQSGEKIQGTLRVFVSSDLTAPANNPPFSFVVTEARSTVMRVTARCSMASFVNLSFPSETFDLARFPSLGSS